jgi:hypothetical protein
VPTIEGGACTNKFGEFSCSCARGFTGSGYSDRDGCTDVNECNDNTHDCGTSQRCLNSFGSFFCECKERSFEAKQSECYASGFWQTNMPLLQAFGFQGEVRLVRQGRGGGANNTLSSTRCFWRSLLSASDFMFLADSSSHCVYTQPTASQGLLRVWDLPGYQGAAQGAALGAAQWVIPRRLQDSGAEEGARSDADAHSLHGSLFYARTHWQPRGTNATALSDMLAKDANDPWKCALGTVDRNLTASEGFLTVEHRSHIEDINISWVFAPQDHAISELYLHWHEFNLMLFDQTSGAEKQMGPAMTERQLRDAYENRNLSQPEWVSLCRHRRPEDRDRFLKLDPDRKGYLIFAQFKNLELVRDLAATEIAKRFAAIDTDDDRKIHFHEWDGELCQYFTSANAPNQTHIRVPFTLMLSARRMAPGINWQAREGVHTIAVSFSPHQASAQPSSMTKPKSLDNSTNNFAAQQQLFMSISNRVTNQSSTESSSCLPPCKGMGKGTLPCAVARSDVSDQYSTLSLVNTTAAVKDMGLHGSWRGTCNPSGTGMGQARCRVDLVLRQVSGSFYLVISGCDTSLVGIPNFAGGFLQEHNPNLAFAMKGDWKTKMCRRVDLTYAYGLPPGTCI